MMFLFFNETTGMFIKMAHHDDFNLETDDFHKRFLNGEVTLTSHKSASCLHLLNLSLFTSLFAYLPLSFSHSHTVS